MKYLLALFIVVLTGISTFGEYHTFSDQDGRKVEASILKYDSVSGKIQLETKSQIKRWIDPGIFPVRIRISSKNGLDSMGHGPLLFAIFRD